MSPDFRNVYDDEARSRAYAALEFPGTYYLAYRDLPALIRAHVRGTRALDFGCGTGRSTRFLRGLGFTCVGVDISEPMLAHARAFDPGGDYRLVPDGDLGALPRKAFDLVLSAFTFDNIPTLEKKVALFRELKELLAYGGRILSVVSSPDIYIHEWASFSTKDYPENQAARCGDRVRIIITDVEDRRPVEDVLWTDAGYRDVYERAGLRSILMSRPLGSPTEPYPWVSETEIAPWVLYLLEPAAAPDTTTRPDFTGTWRFNAARSRLEIAAPEETIFEIDHREPALGLSRTHRVGESRDTFRIDLMTDGSETTLVQGDLQLRARALWEGTTLILDSVVVRAGMEGSNVVRYRLSEDRTTLVAEENFRSGELSYDNVWVLDRVPGTTPPPGSSPQRPPDF